MKLDEILGKSVLNTSGVGLGEVSDLIIDSRSGEITSLEIEQASEESSPGFLPTDLLKIENEDVVLKEETGVAESPGEGDYVYGTGLIKGEVFVKPTWRIGLLADFDIAVDDWELTKLTIDVHPEYAIDTDLHERLMPAGYPPVFEMEVPGAWAQFHISKEPPEKSSHTVLGIMGQDLETSIAKHLER